MFYEFCVGFGNQSKQIGPGHKVQLVNDYEARKHFDRKL